MVSAEFPLMQQPKWARGSARVDSDQIVLDEQAAETFIISESDHRQQLLFDLIALRDCKPKDAVEFVAHHGLLWHGPKDLRSGMCREPLAEWRAAATELWVTGMFYWALMTSETVRTAEPARDLLRTLRSLNTFMAQIPDDDQGCLETVSVLLAERITNGMEGCSWAFVAACTSPSENEEERGPTAFFFRDNPHSLEAAAYAQLATLIVNRVPFARCEGCTVLFRPKHGNQTHCTPECNSRARQARRRTKAKQGNLKSKT